MKKFLITQKSQNPITGPIMVTTSPRATCPTSCPFRKNAANSGTAGVCYAEHGFLGAFIWNHLDRQPIGGSFKKGQIKIRSFDDLLKSIRNLTPNSLWRHNQAGDLHCDPEGNINQNSLEEICAANKGKRGFTYTHHDVLKNSHNRMVILSANNNGFRVNLSANSLSHADQLADLGIAPVTCVVPANMNRPTKTPKGRKVAVCPALLTGKLNCKKCGICAQDHKAIIAFPAIGRGRHKLDF